MPPRCSCTAVFPLALGSFWALVPAAIAVLVLVVRTALEDRMLHNELRRVQGVRQPGSLPAGSRHLVTVGIYSFQPTRLAVEASRPIHKSSRLPGLPAPRKGRHDRLPTVPLLPHNLLPVAVVLFHGFRRTCCRSDATRGRPYRYGMHEPGWLGRANQAVCRPLRLDRAGQDRSRRNSSAVYV